MENVIIILIVLAVVALGVTAVVRAKRRGQVCIGCPHAKECSGCCSVKKKEK